MLRSLVGSEMCIRDRFGAGGVAAVSAAGATTGLSAAGITSGLATIGSIEGGGMATGTALLAAAPVVAAVGVGYGAYKLCKSFPSGQRDLAGGLKETGIGSRAPRRRWSQIPAGFRPKETKTFNQEKQQDGSAFSRDKW